jgi:uncharacterized protein
MRTVSKFLRRIKKTLLPAFVLASFLYSQHGFGGHAEAQAAVEIRDYQAAFLEWEPLAQQGDAEAQHALGRLYFWGHLRGELGLALVWYRKTAEQGYGRAQYALGEMFANGYRGAPIDDSQAAYWWQKAAEQGVALAQLGLGDLFDTGRGVPNDSAQAAFWYRKAAEQDISDAQYKLSLMYEEGRGVPKDDAQAAAWSLKAASKYHQGAKVRELRRLAEQENANAESLYKACVAYRRGKGLPPREHNKAIQTQAFEWCRKAAERGYVHAQVEMGNFYQAGYGVLRDEAIAAEWYRKAAEHGNAYGQLFLGMMYLTGEGVPKDKAHADAWLGKAAEQGLTPSSYFNRLY